jgi:hypothetical protein
MGEEEVKEARRGEAYLRKLMKITSSDSLS